MMMRTTGPSLEITLDKPELLVRGAFDEAQATMLSGKLTVHIPEPLKVRSLKLTFAGRLDLSIAEQMDEHREIISHQWVFLGTQRPPIQWDTTQTFPFDLLVPGDNPETIQTALGKIQYQLQATLERTSFHTNLSASKDVWLKRGPQVGAAWAVSLMESIETQGDWEHQLEYRVSVPTRSLMDGEMFHTKFELEPLVKNLRLVAVGVLLKEYVRYYHTRGGSPVHKYSKIVARNENYINPNGICSTIPRRADECLRMMDATCVTIPLTVPKAYGGIQYDVQTDLIEVRHRIKFLIKLKTQKGLVHSIFIAVPITITPVKARDDSHILPRYEAAVANPGTVIMRSNTLPPCYDTVVGGEQPSYVATPAEDLDCWSVSDESRKETTPAAEETMSALPLPHAERRPSTSQSSLHGKLTDKVKSMFGHNRSSSSGGCPLAVVQRATNHQRNRSALSGGNVSEDTFITPPPDVRVHDSPRIQQPVLAQFNQPN